MITKLDVTHISDLAKIQISEDEIDKYRGWLEETVAYINILDEVDTSKVPPTTQVTGLKNVLREDKPESENNILLGRDFVEVEKTVKR